MQDVNQEISNVLATILKEETGIEVNKAEQDLITGIAKEMLQQNPGFYEEFKKGHLKLQDKREMFKEHLLAATAVAMMIEMMELQKDAQRLLKKYTDPATAKDEKTLIKEKLRNVMGKLNRMDPNAARREKMEELLKDENFIDKLIQMKEDLKAFEKDPNAKIPTLEASKKLNGDLQSMFDKDLESTLRNLYGLDPRVAGAVAFPVMVVMADYAGIPDQFAAISSAASIHRLSGDLDAAGVDEHMTHAEKKAANLEMLYSINELAQNEKLDNSLFNAAHAAPSLRRE